MQLGNRLFPYPVINQEPTISEFKETSSFELKITLSENNDLIRVNNKAVLKDIYFSLRDDDLMRFYNEGKIRCYLIVESSSSIYRQRFELTELPQTIEIPLDYLKDEVYISAYCVAMCDIDNYSSSGFGDDYEGYTFDIKKYDIVAADDGMRFYIDRDLAEDNKVSSIFNIIRNENSISLVSYEMKSNNIYIYMPADAYESYTSLKTDARWNNIFYSMIAIPVLTSCFSEIKASNYSDVDEITDDYRWFRSVCRSYERETKKVLTADEMSNLSPMELAQTVLNYATSKGVNEFKEHVFGVEVTEEGASDE